MTKSKDCGCPGSHEMTLEKHDEAQQEEVFTELKSQLGHWPIQLHLVSPTAPYYEGADVLLTADCVAYAMAGFHQKYLKDKSIAIACPKLDDGQDIYLDKIKSWLEDAKINTLTVLIMQVPCCRGLLGTAQKALEESQRKVPLKSVIVGIKGDILSEEWVNS